MEFPGFIKKKILLEKKVQNLEKIVENLEIPDFWLLKSGNSRFYVTKIRKKRKKYFFMKLVNNFVKVKM